MIKVTHNNGTTKLSWGTHSDVCHYSIGIAFVRKLEALNILFHKRQKLSAMAVRSLFITVLYSSSFESIAKLTLISHCASINHNSNPFVSRPVSGK